MALRPGRRPGRLLRAAFFTVVVGALLYAALIGWATRALHRAIERAAVEAGAEWAGRERCNVRVSPLAGDLSITGLTWRQVLGSPVPPSIQGQLDSLHIEGFSYIAWFREKRIVMDRLRVVLGGAGVVLPAASPGSGAADKSVRGVAIGSAGIRATNVSVMRPDGRTLTLATAGLDAENLEAGRWPGKGIVRYTDLRFEAGQMVYAPFADSALHVRRLSYDGGTEQGIITGLTFGVHDPVGAAVRLGEERDMIAGEAERIELAGLDPRQWTGDRPWHVERITLTGTALRVARDKVLPDPAYVHKALPARLLRLLPAGAGIGVIQVEGMDVDYHERVDRERGFAQVPFRSIQAELRHVRNAPLQDSSMQLRASALLFNEVPLSLRLVTHARDTTDAMGVEACIGHLPFKALSTVLAPLTGIAAPEGHLDTMIVRMRAGDRSADARCWMRYSGLKLARDASRNKAVDPMVNALLNALVKGRRTGGRANDGWTMYTFERRRDRAVFNYLWSSVREGAKASMLPGAVVEGIKGTR